MFQSLMGNGGRSLLSFRKVSKEESNKSHLSEGPRQRRIKEQKDPERWSSTEQRITHDLV